MVKYKYVRVPIKSKKRKHYPKREKQDLSYGLFSASDIGLGFSNSSKGSSIGSFGGDYDSKPESIQKRYSREKQEFEYSKKYNKLKQEKSEYNKKTRSEIIGNVKRGAGNVKRGAEKVGSTISGLFKRKKSLYGKQQWGKKN